MQYNFDQVLDRRHSDSEKWNAYPEDVIPLWVADIDFISPQPVIRALQERVGHGVFGYPAALGSKPNDFPELRRLIVDRMAAHFNWIIEPQDILALPGVIVGFNLASYCTTVPGSGVMIQTPVYPPILRAAQETSCTHQEMELTLEADEGQDFHLRADESCLLILLQNLISNAVRHTPEKGQVRVCLHATPEAVELHVQDSGLGVPPEMRARVFERFFREGPGQGAGLGLSIVSRIVELHGGQVALRDSPLGGLDVVVTLPRNEGTRPERFPGV